MPKYRSAPHAFITIIKEEGIGALYKGVGLTALRQGKDENRDYAHVALYLLTQNSSLATNQAANFTAYQELKHLGKKFQKVDELPSYQTLVIGGISGAMGPLTNAPIDTIKTRIQKSTKLTGSGWERVKFVSNEIYTKEGFRAFYKGLTPRVLRVAPGQAVTFVVYEKVKSWLDLFTEKVKDGEVTKMIAQK